MKSILLLSYDEDTKRIEEEEKSNFLRTILERCFESAPAVIDHIRAIYDTSGPLSVTKKMELRSILTTYNIAVIDDSNSDGTLRVYLDSEEIGAFNKPIYRIKADPQQNDPRKRIYIEMELNIYSSFD